MRISLLLSLLFVGLTASGPAWAQDDTEEEDDTVLGTDDEINFDDFDDDDEDDDIDVERMDDADDLEAEEEEILDYGDDDFGEDEEFDFGDELEELEDDEIGGEGQDNVQIYRDYRDRMDDLGPEEELISWERYLEDYPNSLFKERIDARVEELSNELYGDRISDPNAGGYTDAKDRELNFNHTALLDSIDPRTRGRVGFEMGLPGYVSGLADFEYQIMRQFSAHAGLRTRYTGLNLEFGAKYALVKSARTNTLVTGMLDFHYNTSPGFFGVRPVIGAGHRFDVGGGLEVQAQAGVDLELGRPGPFSARKIGGVHVFYRASDVVGIYGEASINMKGAGDDLENFAFNVVSFGMKFSPKGAPAVIGLNANVPAMYNYWGYHFGAVQADLNYYLDDLGK